VVSEQDELTPIGGFEALASANEMLEYFSKAVAEAFLISIPETEKNQSSEICEPITNQAGGMYNDEMMKHMRPEHDFRKESDKGPICDLCTRWVTSRGDGHENNCLKFGESIWKEEGLRSSVVPWMSA